MVFDFVTILFMNSFIHFVNPSCYTFDIPENHGGLKV